MSWLSMIIISILVASLLYGFDMINRMYTDIKIIRKKVSA